MNRYWKVLCLSVLCLITRLDVLAEERDCTSMIINSACNSTTGWTLASGGSGATLQCDTWSSRGSKDGSNMTVPFMELIISKDKQVSLPDAIVAHSTVTGVVPGTYRLTMMVRCYDEWNSSATDLVGTYVNVVSDDVTVTESVNDEPDVKDYYNGTQLFEMKTVSIEFHVGSSWKFDFNVETRGANYNWVCWKNVTLTRLSIDPDLDVNQLDKTQKTLLLMTGEYQDATFLITNPNMDDSNGWSGGTYGGLSSNRCLEVWNTNFDVHQKLSYIPNGTYHLSVQGYYRYNQAWNNSNYYPYKYQVEQGMAHDEYADQLYAKLYANEVTSPLMSVADEYATVSTMGIGGGDGYKMPFSMNEASTCFSAGLYDGNDYGDNELDVTVTDHALTLGVKKETQVGCDWSIWDNFRLTLIELGDNSDYTPQPQYDIDFSKATWENPVDATSLIANPGYDSGVADWEGSYSTGGSGSGNLVAEKYYGNFDVYQTLTGLPNGHYRLSAQGFYRYGDVSYQQEYSYDYSNQECVNNKVYAMYTIPFAITSRKQGLERIYAKLYANDFDTPFPSLFDEHYEENVHGDDTWTELGYAISSRTGAGYAFSNGDYPMSLTFPVTNGTIRLGVKKNGGYKNDWAVWDNFHLEYLGEEQMTYAKEISTEGALSMTPGEQRTLTATVSPAEATDCGVEWTSSNTSIVSISDGVATAKGNGTAVLTAVARGSENRTVKAETAVTVASTSPSTGNLVINEIMVANVDQFLDPSKNYGGYVELYNPTDVGVQLSGLKISLDGETLYNVTSGAAPAHGFGLIWFDHHSALSSQIDAKLDMDGGTVYLYNQNGEMLTSATYPAAVSRTSYTRLTDGGNAWGVTAFPTPGASNLGSETVLSDASNRLAEPEVSEDSHLFTSPFTLQVTIPEGATLHYTLDGSTPSLSNSLVSQDGKFSIDGTTILRLRLSAPGMLPSPVRTLSYLYRDQDYMLPVLSVVGDPDVFYNDTIGVLVPGVSGVSGSGVNYACNWNMDWERPVVMNYFTLNGDTTYSQEVDMERCGGWSRSWFPYSYKLKASSQYENLNYIAYPFFSAHKPHLKSKALQLRNGGNDLLCRIKDASLTYLITSCGWHVDCQDYQSVHSFVNGRYQGMLNLREPNNKHFAYTNYGIDTDEMDAMEITGGISVKEGTADKFWEWSNLSAQCADPAVYQQICNLVDIDEFANYMAAQIYLGGDDWPGNNCKGFRDENDGKFHIVFFDVDQALRYDAYAFKHVSESSVPLMKIFKNMIAGSESFRRQFIDAFSIVAGSVYEPSRVDSIITRMAEEMEPALALEGLEPWSTANNTIRVLASETRQETMMEGLKQLTGINLTTQKQQLKLQSNIAAVRFTLNGQDVPTNYFNGYIYPPCTLGVKAPSGYEFAGWIDEEGDEVSTDSLIDLDGVGDISLTASFRALPDSSLVAALAMPVKINEVGAANSIFVNEYFKKGDWIELYNNTDSELDVAGLYLSDNIDQPMKYQIPQSSVLNTRIPAAGHLVVWADNLTAVSQIHSGFKLSNDEGSLAMLSSSTQFVANNADFFDKHPELKSFADGMIYCPQQGQQSVGRYPDGARSFYLMNRPSIDRTNNHLMADSLVGYDAGIMADIQTFQLDLAEGWNWMSHPLYRDVRVNEFADYARQILSETQQANIRNAQDISGTLTTLVPGMLYKTLMSEDAQYSLPGKNWNPEKGISLHQGWNWVGYSLTGAQTLSEALKNYSAQDGEVLMGQQGTSIYDSASEKWIGTLTTLEPGVGYLFRAAADKTLTLSPVSEVQIRYKSLRHVSGVTRVPARSQYPDVMTIVGTLSINGEEPTPDTYTLRAYCDGELRGVGQYVDNLIFLTLYGNAGDPLTFTISADEQEETLPTTCTFNQGVLGTLAQPYPFTLNKEVDALPEIALSADEAGTIRSIQYFGLDGRRISQPSHGFYLERVTYENGRVVTNKRNK